MNAASDAEPIPVDILTGFLGAGKTTLIRRLVEAGALSNTAILVNEFAALPLDQRLIALSGGRAAVIGDGCICCIVDGNARAALLDLAARRATGDVPAFSRILIETSGIADPTLLIATLATDRMLKPRFRLGRVVTLVDLSQDAATLDEESEAMAQIIAADLILLTKADRAPIGAEAGVASRIAALNPIADIRRGEGATNPFAPSAPIRQQAGRPFSAAPGVLRHGTVRSAVLRWPDPVEWPAFAAWLSLLAHRHGPKLLRIKGTVALAGDERQAPVLIQSVRHIVHRPEHLPSGSGPSGVELVVIARDLDPALLQHSLSAFLGASRPSAPVLSAAG